MAINHQECPKCGRLPEKISTSGKAGFCPIHIWFELTPDEAARIETAKLNEQYSNLTY